VFLGVVVLRVFDAILRHGRDGGERRKDGQNKIIIRFYDGCDCGQIARTFVPTSRKVYTTILACHCC
jgi:hypothetical protein